MFRRLIRHTGSGKVNLKALDVGPQFSAHMGMRLLPATRWSKFMNFEILMFLLLNAAGVNASERRVAVAFAPGYLTAQGTVAYAVSAEAEYNLQGRISLRGDLYALAAKSKPGVLQQSYQAMLGIVYNFERSGALVPFAGFQPGMGFATVSNGVAHGFYIYPTMSPVAGAHLYLGESWHLTSELRYVFGELHYADTGAVYLSEFRATLGLGYSF